MSLFDGDEYNYDVTVYSPKHNKDFKRIVREGSPHRLHPPQPGRWEVTLSGLQSNPVLIEFGWAT